MQLPVRSRKKDGGHAIRSVVVTDLYIHVPPVHVVSNHIVTDKLTAANGGTFTSSSGNLSSRSR